MSEHQFEWVSQPFSRVRGMPIVIEIPTVEEVRALRNGPESRDLDAALADLEVASRLVEGAIAAAVRHGDERCGWGYDGHRSATPWVESVMGTSRGRALGRVRVSRFAELGLQFWADAVSAATLGVEQAWALGRVASISPMARHCCSTSRSPCHTGRSRWRSTTGSASPTRTAR